ncbi:MAG: hypothetical protein ACOZCL_06505 [Bacillota bacterium]
MISIKPMKPLIKTNILFNQVFSLHIIGKYTLMRSSFFEDVPLVFLRLADYERNGDGISQLLMDVRLQISMLKSMHEQVPETRKASMYYLEKTLINQENILNIYNKAFKDISNYKSTAFFNDSSKVYRSSQHVYRDRLKDADDENIGVSAQLKPVEITDYSKSSPDLFIYRFFHRDNIRSNNELKITREYYRGREAKSIIGSADRIMLNRAEVRMLNQVTLKQERLWNRLYRHIQPYGRLPIYGKMYEAPISITDRSTLIHNEVRHKKESTEKLYEASNNTLIYNEQYRDKEIVSKESEKHREIRLEREYYSNRVSDIRRELYNIIGFAKRMVFKDISSIGSLITYKQEEVLSRFYKDIDIYRKSPVYVRIHEAFISITDRSAAIRSEVRHKKESTEKLYEASNNTLIYNEQYRVKEIASKDSENPREARYYREYYSDRVFNVRSKLNNVREIIKKIERRYNKYKNLYYESVTGSNEQNSFIEYNTSQVFKYKKDYYRDLESYVSREYNNIREHTESSVLKDIVNIMNHITHKKEEIWGRVLYGKEQGSKQQAYVIKHLFPGAVWYRYILSHENYKQKISREVKCYETSKNMMVHSERHFSKENNSFPAKASAAVQLSKTEKMQTYTNVSNLITEHKEYFGQAHVLHGRYDITKRVFNILAAAQMLAANKRIGAAEKTDSNQSKVMKAFSGTGAVYRKSYLKRTNINQYDTNIMKSSTRKNITAIENLEEKQKIINHVNKHPLVIDSEDLQHDKRDYGMMPPSLNYLTNKASQAGGGNANATKQQQQHVQTHVDIDMPKNEEISISRSQMEKIVDKVYKELEKKIQFERHRRGL